MILIHVSCTYPGMGLAPTSLTFEPVGLGDTAEEVDRAFRELLKSPDIFYVEAKGESLALPFWVETIREVRVWETTVHE